ncbi:MAG: bifunctional phosphoglucose/phosphomannose isomerase [Candidatus Azambacteria bacterium]|nr:bifunctional phosphoglucose/phosphomannose isomerase [Candidatus Azambacteria bacterium]
MIEDVINKFPEQFTYEPEIHNGEHLPKAHAYIVAGMGGSALAAELLRARDSEREILIHRGYGLPRVSESVLKRSVFIAISYSGNTEETLDAFIKAHAQGMSVAVIASGGKLIELAQEHEVPYIQIPNTGIQPRHANGFVLKALMKLMGDEDGLTDVGTLIALLDPSRYQEEGKALAVKLKGKVPVIYASAENGAIAYNWKIKFNESAKIPAFHNVFSELNHNEMTGFDIIDSTKPLSNVFHFIFLTDENDHPRIVKRMELTKQLYTDRGLSVEAVKVEGESAWHGVFASLVLADWTAYYCALQYGTEPEQVPMVEEFKKMME